MTITREMIERVFKIGFASHTATGFTVNRNGTQYLVTARHIFDSNSAIPQNPDIEIFCFNRWQTLPCSLIGVGANDDDIAVLKLQSPIGTLDETNIGTTGLNYGQEVYFLGFPFGRTGDFPFLNNGYPLPYIKRALVSMLNGPGHPELILDGINNEGFSGGPVAFVDSKTGNWKIAAVVSSYNSERAPVYKKGTDEELSDLEHEYNSGLIHSCPIDVATNIIDLVK